MATPAKGQGFRDAGTQSAYIPAGTEHRLENQTYDPLYVVEVQLWEYIGEDDNVRLEDVYGLG